MHRDIDALIGRVREFYPAVLVEQLKVLHPVADDDGLWFFRSPSMRGNIQVESSTGNAPFTVETNYENGCLTGLTLEQTLGAKLSLLERATAGMPNQSTDPTPSSGTPPATQEARHP